MEPVRPGPLGGAAAKRRGLMGEDIGTYIKIHERIREFPVPPTSIWATNPPRSAAQEELREYVGDDGSSRSGSFGTGRFLPASPGQEASDKASVFNPELAAMLVAAYTVPEDVIIDPFAGGGTRAIVAASAGRNYRGIDIREDEMERVAERVQALALSSRVKLDVADATTWQWPPGEAAALITCPPYWNLEVYTDDDDRDLSRITTYSGFLNTLEKVVKRGRWGVKEDGVMVWVVGEFRHPDTGELLDFPGDVVRLHQQQGAWLYDRIVYTPNNQQATRRAGTFDRTRKVVRVHEHVLVFRVGGRGSGVYGG